jgi:predicted O-linked N-acetylglucosamine transferase (SPINDLY family)
MKAQAKWEQGLAAHQQGALEQARALYERVLKWHPNHFDAVHMLGLVAYQQGHLDRAALLIAKALKIDPDTAFAHNNYANVLQDQRKLTSALASYDRAISLDPQYAEAHNNRGDVLQVMGRLPEALLSYARALEISPRYAAAFYNQGNAFGRLGRWREAVESYDQALSIESQYPQALMNRGNALFELRDNEAATQSYKQALSIDPAIPYLAGTLLHVNMQQCKWADYRTQLEALLIDLRAHKPSCLPFPLLSLTDDAALHKQVAQAWIETEYTKPRAAWVSTARSRHKKLRIGYFSGDFRNHPVAYLTAGLFEEHDRSQFEIFAFSFGPDTPDDMRLRLEKAFDHFVDVKDCTDTQLIARAREADLDIAIDLMGLTKGCRPRIFLARVAPVQMSYLGYPGTTGIAEMDYILVDQTIAEPVDASHYTEKFIRLAHSFQVNDPSRRPSDRVFSRAELGLPPTGFVFCCFNNNYKINPAIFDCWMRMLQSVPGSVLWLREATEQAAQNLRDEARARGVEATRLVFAGRIESMADHLARQRAADLFVDALPYNAHTTASDALWAGVPVLTCKGQSYASRVGASLLRALDLSELITNNLDEYVQLAVALAQDPARLSAVRSALQQKLLVTPLFDIKRFTRNIEQAFLTAIERKAAGLPNDHLDIND